ncbi:unnamed protein product, partial [Medioppia subpectinata]
MVCDEMYRCEGYSGHHFKKHLVRFVFRHKHYLKKKGAVAGAAALAAVATSKKKVIPVPFPLPIPIIHQPVIHDPLLTLKYIKQAKFHNLGVGGLHGGIG